MSASGNLEPQAFGLIKIKTNFGDLELELFTKQCPKLTRNFVQLCLEGYYKDTIFDRVEKDFIAVGGIRSDKDVRSKILKEELDNHKDEFHSRLRFTRRGLLATANTQKDKNGAEFFFTLGSTPELQNKHSIIGRLKGRSVYCLVDLNECQVDDDLKPLSEKTILETEVVENPFPGLEARPEILQILAGGDEEEKTDRQNKSTCELGLFKSNKKLSFQPAESDEESSEEEGETPQECDRITSSQKEAKSLIDSMESNQGKIHDSESNVRRENLSEESRQKRLREVREQFQDLKKKFECDSATKIKTLTERRGLKRQSEGSDEQSINSSSSSLFDQKGGRDRGRETINMVHIFRKKLKEMSKRSTSSHQDTPHKRNSNLITDCDLDEHDEEDNAQLKLELDMLSGDDWLEHRFVAQDDEIDLSRSSHLEQNAEKLSRHRRS